MVKKILEKYKYLPVQMRASFWFLICVFLQKGISVITTPIFTRLLSTTEYGQYSVFNSWYSIVAVFATLNLHCGVYTQGLVKFDSEKKVYSSSLLGLMTTMVAIWTVIYVIFSDFWNGLFSLTTVQMLAMLSMIWASTAFNFWAVAQRVDFKYRTLVLVTIFISFAKPIIEIILVLRAEDKMTARILGLAIFELIVYTGFFFVQMGNGKKFFSMKFWKYALVFNIPLIPHYLSSTVLNSADRIMINGMIGSGEAGIYNLAYSISQVMIIFNATLMQTVEPWLYKKIHTKRVQDISKVAYPTFLMIAGVNIGLIAIAPEVVAFFAPSEYSAAIWIIPPVAMSVFFMFTYAFFAVFEFYYEKTKYITIATLLGAVTNVVLNYIFIRIFGYYAAGYTTLLCYMIYSGFHYIFMRKLCKEKLNNVQVYDNKFLLSIIGGFLVIGFLLLFTYGNMLFRYGILIILLIVVILIKKKIITAIGSILEVRKK